TLLWDYPTINALAEYLVSELQQLHHILGRLRRK
ncbi:acyl carrier protein, partial [Acinetobacter baumannii]